MDNSVLSLFVTAFSFVMAVYVLGHNHKRRANQLFAALLLINSVSAFSYFLSQTLAEAKTWSMLNICLLLFMPPIIFHFSLIFPEHKPRRVFMDVAYSLYVLAIILFFVAMGRPAISPQLGGMLLFFMELVILLGIVDLVRARKRLKHGIEKDQALCLITAFALVSLTVPFAMIYYWVWQIASLLAIGLIAYAIFRYNFLVLVPEAEAGLKSASQKPGVYWIDEEPYKMFTGLVRSGSHGLCITAGKPSLVRKKTGLKRTPMVHLSHSEDGAIKPSEIEHLSFTIADFVEKTEKPVVLLDCHDMMARHHNDAEMHNFVSYLKKKIVPKGVLIIRAAKEKAEEF
jgi:hypothetical protein